MEMDAIDKRQQEEINDLRDLSKNIVWAFLLMAFIQFSSMCFALWEATKACPHKECPHHQRAK